jgi:hypothetical protein
MLRNFSETNHSVYLMPCPWSDSGLISGEAVERCWPWETQTELSCLLRATSPAEAVETQRVSAHSVCAHTEPAISHKAHKI